MPFRTMFYNPLYVPRILYLTMAQRVASTKHDAQSNNVALSVTSNTAFFAAQIYQFFMERKKSPRFKMISDICCTGMHTWRGQHLNIQWGSFRADAFGTDRAQHSCPGAFKDRVHQTLASHCLCRTLRCLYFGTATPHHGHSHHHVCSKPLQCTSNHFYTFRHWPIPLVLPNFLTPPAKAERYFWLHHQLSSQEATRLRRLQTTSYRHRNLLHAAYPTVCPATSNFFLLPGYHQA